MDWLRNYLISVVAACMIAAIATAIIKDAMIGKVVKLVSGILILLVVISPLLKIDLDDVSQSLHGGADLQIIDDAQDESHKIFAEQIKNATQMHIEQIAERFGMTIQAEVSVDNSSIPMPVAVELIGIMNAEQLANLTEYIEQNIGIPKENQHWRDYDS